MKRAALACAFATLWCGWASAQPQTPQVRENNNQTVVEHPNSKKPTGGDGLLIDHGGPVLSSSKTYAIYWGTQSDFAPDLNSAMASLLAGFNGSSYLGIGAQYMRGASISSAYAGAIVDTSTPPSHAPSTATLGAEVCKLVPSPDQNAIYIVFTSNAPKNVNYCSFHDKATCNGVTFQVAYVPNQAALPGCSPTTRSNLQCNNYSNATLSSADSVAHEFMEAVTDPHINAWLDQSGQEIADKCNFNYQACVNLGGSLWQIQSMWSNAISGCQQQ
jgi:hypothetical protein